MTSPSTISDYVTELAAPVPASVAGLRRPLALASGAGRPGERTGRAGAASEGARS